MEKTKISKFFSAHSFRNLYILIGLLAVGSYFIMRQRFISQDAWWFVKSNQVTLNVILLFGLWGGFYNKIIKIKNKKLSVVVWFAGFVLLLVLLIASGLKTIFSG